MVQLVVPGAFQPARLHAAQFLVAPCPLSKRSNASDFCKRCAERNGWNCMPTFFPTLAEFGPMPQVIRVACWHFKGQFNWLRMQAQSSDAQTCAHRTLSNSSAFHRFHWPLSGTQFFSVKKFWLFHPFPIIVCAQNKLSIQRLSWQGIGLAMVGNSW